MTEGKRLMQAELDLIQAHTNGRAAQAAERTGEPARYRLLEGVRKRVALVRIGFGVLWAIDAWYKWQPAFQRGFASEITRPGKTAPAVLRPWFDFWQRTITPHAAFFALCTALLETVLALCLVLGLGRRSVYLAGGVFSFLIWAVPEAFGRFWSAGQTDLGTSIMYVFVFAALYVLDSGAGAGGWSLDRLLARRAPRWSVVAEP
jgi:thiosulfate dehydrogenase [quinone] large subunit